MTLDLTFLEVPLAPMRARPVNVYDILSDGWRENRVDMTLEFFLDPNERHGLGSLVMDALLKVLNGAALIGEAGKTGTTFAAAEYTGSDAWEIDTQVENIDVLATNSERRIAVVLENKIAATLHNDLERYAGSALGGAEITDLLVAVLAPEHRRPNPAQENWLSGSITYEQLFDAIKSSPDLVQYLLDPRDRDQGRSLDLLQQFIEARSPHVNDLSSEAAHLDEWRALLEAHRDAIQAFEDTKTSVEGLVQKRGQSLGRLLADRTQGVDGLTWEGVRSGHWGIGYFSINVCRFTPGDARVELALSTGWWEPKIFVRPKTAVHEPERKDLLAWTAKDEEIVAAFIDYVNVIRDEVRNGVGTA